MIADLVSKYIDVEEAARTSKIMICQFLKNFSFVALGVFIGIFRFHHTLSKISILCQV